MSTAKQPPLSPVVSSASVPWRWGVSAVGTAFAVCATLGTGGCKKDDPGAGAEADATKAQQVQTRGESDSAASKASAKPGGGGPTAADELSPATQLQKGEVLGHVLLPDASSFLAEVKNQAAPQSAAAFLEEQMLRTMAAGQLGARSNLAKNVDLARPMGCALVDLTVTDVPLACIVGYKGGTDAIVTDLGDQGKQADAAGHVAHYQLGGQDVYIDALKDHVVLTNHPEVFAKAKDYLGSNMIDRADKVVSDVEIVGYMSGLLKRYEKDLQPFIDQVAKPQTISASSNKFSEAMAAYNAKSTLDMIQRFRDMEQITVGLGLEPAGFVLRYAVFPSEGSRLAEESKASAAGTLNTGIIESLPKSSWAVVGMTTDWTRLAQTETATEFRKLMVDAYADAVGKDPAAVNEAVEGYFEEAAGLYGNDVAYGVMHEPGTVGALLISMRLQDGKDARDRWKAWTEQFTPENVLDGESREKITWSFTTDAYALGDLPVDRWVIEPTPAGLAELKAETGPALAAWEKKLGGLKIVIDRAELEDRVLFLVAPAAEKKYMASAVEAAKGTDDLEKDAGLKGVLSHSVGLSGLFAVNVQGATDWLRDVMPADKASEIPASLGNDLSDVYVAQSYSESGTQTGQFVVSQPFIDQLRALANQ